MKNKENIKWVLGLFAGGVVGFTILGAIGAHSLVSLLLVAVLGIVGWRTFPSKNKNEDGNGGSGAPGGKNKAPLDSRDKFRY